MQNKTGLGLAKRKNNTFYDYARLFFLMVSFGSIGLATLNVSMALLDDSDNRDANSPALITCDEEPPKGTPLPTPEAGQAYLCKN